jgi:hypothetical protein
MIARHTDITRRELKSQQATLQVIELVRKRIREDCRCMTVAIHIVQVSYVSTNIALYFTPSVRIGARPIGNVVTPLDF